MIKTPKNNQKNILKVSNFSPQKKPQKNNQQCLQIISQKIQKIDKSTQFLLDQDKFDKINLQEIIQQKQKIINE